MNQLNGNVLAFIGDAVLSLQVREYLVSLNITNSDKLQKLSTQFVSAKAQATFIKRLIEDNILTEEELLFFRRGRNAKSQSVAKNQTIGDYRNATGFEALWGYLYLEKYYDRLEFLWNLFKEEVTL